MNADDSERGRDRPARSESPPGKESDDAGGRHRDLWDRIEILGRPLTAVIAAAIVGMAGFIGNCALEKEQNTRLYTELLSRREEAESNLRTSMFTAALDDFFSRADSTAEVDERENVDDRLLRLEMLALNFGESLTLSPLFLELDRDIQALDSTLGPWWQVHRDIYHERLHSLARRVAGAQLAALAPAGKSFEIIVPLDLARSTEPGAGFVWPDSVIYEGFTDDSGVLAILEGYPQEERSIAVESLKVAWADSLRTDHGVVNALELAGISRTYRVAFYAADPARKTVSVQLEIFEEAGAAGAVFENDDRRPLEFVLSFFDFPMIDNTRLARNQRFALTMEGFDDEYLHVTGIVFEGQLASHRDKPFLNEAISQLRGLGEGTEGS